jgi:Major membrane immunogen, membrane-anchored lipoprotein
MRDGYYSARALSFNNSGWEEFITLYIHNNRIITVEYNARNASGLILTWDVLYMRKIKEKMGVHPNQILREYSRELLNRQDPKSVRKVHGDTYFYETFRKLAAAAVKQAEAGNKAVAEISLTESAAPSQ